MEEVETLVIGAGQAGIAASEHLTRNAIAHVVLEKNRVAEAWRSGRWDSLKANGPAWHDRFPNMSFQNCPPDGFAGKEEVADYLSAYADMIKAPIRTGVEVRALSRAAGEAGFEVVTSDGTFHAQSVISATGAFQTPVLPDMVPKAAGVHQIHSAAYRTPEALPEGAVLVVGSGSSGGQIANEMCQSGRKTFLSVGPHDRPPRAYRGRDYCWWLGVLGLWDLAAKEPGTEHLTITVSGANGGRTVDFRELAHEGITLLGRTSGYRDGQLQVADDLQANIAAGDANYLDMLDQADAYIDKFNLDLPEEPEARQMLPDPVCLTHPLRSVDLKEEGISTIIWATGYAQDFSWMQLDAFDGIGAPIHQRGVSKEPGLYFLGLPWQSRRGSTFIWGVWHDAAYVADQIAVQRNYRNYAPGDTW